MNVGSRALERIISDLVQRSAGSLEQIIWIVSFPVFSNALPADAWLGERRQIELRLESGSPGLQWSFVAPMWQFGERQLQRLAQSGQLAVCLGEGAAGIIRSY